MTIISAFRVWIAGGAGAIAYKTSENLSWS